MTLKAVAAAAFVVGVLGVLARKASSSTGEEPHELPKPGETRVQINNRHYFISKASDGQHKVERRDEATGKVMGGAFVKEGSIVDLVGEEGQDETLAQLATDLPKFPKEVWK